jgi:predicted AAA+ superfamily ATPase
MIDRRRQLDTLTRLLARNRVVAILGARQVGKTTLARTYAKGQGRPFTIFDLELPQDLARLADPELALADLSGLIILDEIQRRPDLFPVLRALVDRPRSRARFLVLGSASPDLLRQSSETLAGRIAYHTLSPFALDEVGSNAIERLWLRGGFPRSFTARSLRDSTAWRRDFVRTFLERDLPQLGLTIPAATLRRFWTMLAHYHGQVWNASEFARAFGVTDHTVRRYLDILASTFVVSVLQPWTENLSKRQVKSPKVYLADSGLLHSLLGLDTLRDLTGHPKVGASWEGFALRLVAERLGVEPGECHFWATHAGAELDLVIVRGRTRLGFEFKRTTAPRLTPSMRTALVDLGLSRLDVIHAGADSFPLAPRVRAVAAQRLLEEIEPLR